MHTLEAVRKYEKEYEVDADKRQNDKITALCCVSTGKERKWQKSKKTVKQKRGC